MVTEKTIANYFRHIGFIPNEAETFASDEEDDDNIPLARASLPRKMATKTKSSDLYVCTFFKRLP